MEDLSHIIMFEDKASRCNISDLTEDYLFPATLRANCEYPLGWEYLFHEETNVDLMDDEKSRDDQGRVVSFEYDDSWKTMSDRILTKDEAKYGPNYSTITLLSDNFEGVEEDCSRLDNITMGSDFSEKSIFTQTESVTKDPNTFYDQIHNMKAYD